MIQPNAGISAIVAEAWKLTKTNLVVLIGLILSLFLYSFLMQLFRSAIALTIPVLNLLVTLMDLGIQMLFSIGLIRIALKFTEQKEAEMKDFLPDFPLILRFMTLALINILIFLLVAFITVGILGVLNVFNQNIIQFFRELTTESNPLLKYSSIEIVYGMAIAFLLMMPAILVYIRLSFASYIMVDKRTDVFDSLIKSFRITRSQLFRIIGLFLIILLLNILGALLLLIGLLVTVPLSFMIIIVYYRSISYLLDPDMEIEEPLNE